MEHTKEPWWTDGKYSEDEAGCAIIAANTDCGPLPGNPTRGMVAFATELLPDRAKECEANARRIVACVNACAGIADPAAEIAKLREDLAEAVGALEGFVECARYSPHMNGNHSFIGWRQSDLRGAESRARATLARIKGE